MVKKSHHHPTPAADGLMIRVRMGNECWHRGKHLQPGDEITLPASAHAWLVEQGVALTDVTDSAATPNKPTPIKGDKP